MLPSELLQRGWCQRAFRRDKNGDVVATGVKDRLSPVSWCMRGAIEDSNLIYEERKAIYSLIRQIANTDSFVLWQDRLPYTKESQDLVVNVMRKAEVELGLHDAT